MINVELSKQHNENNASLIRRFTRRVRSAGVINRMRGLRYYTRKASETARRMSKLKMLTRSAEIETLLKLGRIRESQPRHSRR